MDWKLFTQLLVTAVVAFSGAWLTHQFSSSRDARNDQRKLRVQHLLDAYRTLERATVTPDGPEKWANWEKVAVDIQLLGNAQQVKLVQDWVVEFTDKQAAPLNPLLESLRRSLRKELGLEKVPDIIHFLRMTPK